MKRLIDTIKRLWYASPFHRHTWYFQVICGSGISLKTGQIVSHYEEFEVCIRCKKKRPRS